MLDEMRADVREPKLPAWARETISRLRSRVLHAERSVEVAAADVAIATGQRRDGSNTFVDLGVMDEPLGLGGSPVIRFVSATGASFEVTLDGDHLVVDSGQRLAVIPVALNVVHLQDRRAS